MSLIALVNVVKGQRLCAGSGEQRREVSPSESQLKLEHEQLLNHQHVQHTRHIN